jgi:hypothetical protein
MSEIAYSIDRDLKEADEMAKSLVDYVRQDELYGRLSGGFFGSNRMPSLTVGALLMRLRRLRALQEGMSPAQRTKLDEIEARHNTVRKEWTMHYNEKMVREAHSRLDAMRHFFDECQDAPRQCAANYMPEALRRTIVQELKGPIADSYADDKDLAAKMRRADTGLRRYAAQSPFIWDAALESVYPKADYWWLYARPQVNENK